MSTSKAERIYGEITWETGFVKSMMNLSLDKYELEELIGLLEDKISQIDQEMKDSEDDTTVFNESVEEYFQVQEENAAAVFDNTH